MPLQRQFSKMIGEDPSFLRGRSFLNEIDPSTPFERSVASFVSELSQGGCSVFVFTHTTSPVYKLLAKEPKLKFLISTDSVSYLKSTEKENEMLVPQNELAVTLDVMSKTIESSNGSCVVFVIDSISDLMVSMNFESVYKFLKSANEILSDSHVSSMFLLARGIHDPRVMATIRSLFSTHVLSGADGGIKLVRKS